MWHTQFFWCTPRVSFLATLLLTIDRRNSHLLEVLSPYMVAFEGKLGFSLCELNWGVLSSNPPSSSSSSSFSAQIQRCSVVHSHWTGCRYTGEPDAGWHCGLKMNILQVLLAVLCKYLCKHAGLFVLQYCQHNAELTAEVLHKFTINDVRVNYALSHNLVSYHM